MNKKELIATISAQCPQVSKKDIGDVIAAFPEAIKVALIAGDTVSLIGFGTFKVSDRAGRTGRNPATGAEMQIPASKSPKFVAGSSFREALRPKL